MSNIPSKLFFSRKCFQVFSWIVKPSSCPSQLCQGNNEGWGWDPPSCHPASDDGSILGEHLKKRKNQNLDKLINRIPRSESEFLGIFFGDSLQNHHLYPGEFPTTTGFSTQQGPTEFPMCHDDSGVIIVILPHCAEPRKALEDGPKVGGGMFWEALSCWRLGAGEVGSGYKQMCYPPGK